MMNKNQKVFYYSNDRFNDNESETNAIITSVGSKYFHIKLIKNNEKIRIDKNTGFRILNGNECGDIGKLFLSKSDYLNYLKMLESKNSLINKIKLCNNFDTINKLIDVINQSTNNDYNNIMENL